MVWCGMSLELTFPGNSLDQEGWQELLFDFAAEFEPYSGLTFSEEDAPIAHLLTPQSIRGVLMRLEADGLRLRVNAWGSRADWVYAYGIARLAIERGGGDVRRCGTPVPADALSDTAAKLAANDDFQASVNTAIQLFQHENDTFRLPIGTFMVDIRRADLPAADAWNSDVHDALESKLNAQIQRYAAAVFAQPRQIDGATLANWNQGPTILPKVDYLSLNGPWHVCDGVVALDATLAILGVRAEEVGDHENPAWYLPAVDFESESALAAEFAKAAVPLDSLVPDDAGIRFPEAWSEEFPYEYEDIEPICMRLTELLPTHPDPVALVSAMRAAFENRELVDGVLDAFQIFMSIIGPEEAEETPQPAVIADQMMKRGVPERFAIFAVIAFLGGKSAGVELQADVDRVCAMIADKTEDEFSDAEEQARMTATLIQDGMDPVRAASLIPDTIDALRTLTRLLRESPNDILDRMRAESIDPAMAQAVINAVRSSQNEPGPKATEKSGCLGLFLVAGLLWLAQAVH